MKIKEFALSLLLILSMLAAPAGAANDTKAKNMTLEDTEGTVVVHNAKKKQVTIRDGGRLYKGYKVTTDDGYAWVGLDDSKVIKLDWNTEITLKKSGRKLEILLETGALFFNVKTPLEEDESLAIRTSNMYTGIRGTSGVISLQRQEHPSSGGAASSSRFTTISTVTVYDGRVQVSNIDPETPQSTETYFVEAGWQGQVSTLDVLTAPDLPEIPDAPKVETALSPIPVQSALSTVPFAAVEVAKDEELRQRVEETAALQADQGIQDIEAPQQTLDNTLAQAHALLQQENAQRKEQIAAFLQDVLDTIQDFFSQAEQEAAPPPPVFTPPASGGSSTPSTPTEHTVTYCYLHTWEPEAGDLVSEELVFATQTVAHGATISMPMLQPGPAGDWYPVLEGGTVSETPYDWSAPVTTDLKLLWQDPLPEV